jgi:hypothetical protein
MPSLTMISFLSWYSCFRALIIIIIMIRKSLVRRKRKAAEAALDAILRIHQAEETMDCHITSAIKKNPISATMTQESNIFFSTSTKEESDVDLPKDVVIHVLTFLPKQDLVHHVSLVSLSWLAASWNSFLWTELSAGLWKQKKNNSEKPIFRSIKHFCDEFLSRPQFASLKFLSPPDISRGTGRIVFDRIAKVCPHLEALNLSGYHSRYHSVVPHDCELLRIPALFPKLEQVILCMRFVTNDALLQFVRLMGGRLKALAVLVGIGNHCCSDDTLVELGRSCPNLEFFRYEKYCSCPLPQYISKRGVAALLEGCPKLGFLSLFTSADHVLAIDSLLEEH